MQESGVLLEVLYEFNKLVLWQHANEFVEDLQPAPVGWKKQFGQHLHFAASAHRLDVHRCTHLSVLHSDNSGHGGNIKVLSNLLMLINIDGYQIHHFPTYHLRLRSDFFESGGEKFAWLTPDCEEIYQYWCLCLCA